MIFININFIISRAVAFNGTRRGDRNFGQFDPRHTVSFTAHRRMLAELRYLS